MSEVIRPLPVRTENWGSSVEVRIASVTSDRSLNPEKARTREETREIPPFDPDKYSELRRHLHGAGTPQRDESGVRRSLRIVGQVLFGV